MVQKLFVREKLHKLLRMLLNQKKIQLFSSQMNLNTRKEKKFSQERRKRKILG